MQTKYFGDIRRRQQDKKDKGDQRLVNHFLIMIQIADDPGDNVDDDAPDVVYKCMFPRIRTD